jgi:hypothetical protein
MQAKVGPRRTPSLAVSPRLGVGERGSGPFVARDIRACVGNLATNLNHFKPPRCTKRWVGLKYVVPIDVTNQFP